MFQYRLLQRGLRTLVLILLTGCILPATLLANWKNDFKEVKIGILSGENEKDRVQRHEKYAEYMSRALGVPVKIYTASAYEGVMQAMAANQIEFAFYGSSSYAGAWKEMDGGVIPLLTSLADNGSTGYFSVIVVRSDSAYKTVEDLKGKTLAFADPNSTSGYAVPYFNLKKAGYDPEKYFGATPFSGAHETGVLGVINGQFDAAATYIKTEVDGTPQRMAEKGMIPAGSVKWIWKSPELTNGPFTARANLPKDLIEAATLAMFRITADDPEAFEAMKTESQIGWMPVNHKRYDWILEMRDEITKLKRDRGNK